MSTQAFHVQLAGLEVWKLVSPLKQRVWFPTCTPRTFQTTVSGVHQDSVVCVCSSLVAFFAMAFGGMAQDANENIVRRLPTKNWST